jgi:hypothetical protein
VPKRSSRLAIVLDRGRPGRDQWFAGGTFDAMVASPLMNMITRTTIAAFAACSFITANAEASVPVVAATARSATGAPITLKAHPGTGEDAVARQLMAPELAAARNFGEAPLVLISSAQLGATRDSQALFVQIQSARECGSAGCDTVSFRKINGTWVRILDTVSGAIRVAPTAHRGMQDLIVQETRRLVWDGTRYG